MKNILGMVMTALKWGGSFLEKSAITGTMVKGFKNPFSANVAGHAWKALKLQAFMLPLQLIMPGSPHEKMRGVATNLAVGMMTMGMNSPWRQFGWATALSLMPHFGSMVKGVVRGYRGAMESRTSAAIPFSSSTVAMDQAFATLQYSRQRMSEAYQNVGSEAAFFAARYMARS